MLARSAIVVQCVLLAVYRQPRGVEKAFQFGVGTKVLSGAILYLTFKETAMNNQQPENGNQKNGSNPNGPSSEPTHSEGTWTRNRDFDQLDLLFKAISTAMPTIILLILALSILFASGQTLSRAESVIILVVSLVSLVSLLALVGYAIYKSQSSPYAEKFRRYNLFFNAMHSIVSLLTVIVLAYSILLENDRTFTSGWLMTILIATGVVIILIIFELIKALCRSRSN